MSTKSKAQANKEFLAKIKTITVGTGAKSSDKCDHCGEAMGDHDLVLAAGIIVPLRKKEAPKAQPEESSFAA